MSPVALPNLNQVHVQDLVDAPQPDRSDRFNEIDAYAGIDELRALHENVDALAPPEAAEMAEPLVDLYRGEVNADDRLRLPLVTAHGARAVSGALVRLLSVDRSVPFPDRDAVTKEAKMIRLLNAYRSATAQIHGRSALASSY